MNARNDSASYIISRTRGIPRGAAWAADVAVSASKALRALMAPFKRGMRASAQARARAEILSLADTYEQSQPTFAAELRAASAFADREFDSKP